MPKKSEENKLTLVVAISLFKMDLGFRSSIFLRFVHFREVMCPHRFERSFHCVLCNQSNHLPATHALSLHFP